MKHHAKKLDYKLINYKLQVSATGLSPLQTFNLSVLLTRTSPMTILILLTVQPYGNYVSRSRLTRTVIIRNIRILATIEFVLLLFIVLCLKRAQTGSRNL